MGPRVSEVESQAGVRRLLLNKISFFAAKIRHLSSLLKIPKDAIT